MENTGIFDTFVKFCISSNFDCYFLIFTFFKSKSFSEIIIYVFLIEMKVFIFLQKLVNSENIFLNAFLQDPSKCLKLQNLDVIFFFRVYRCFCVYILFKSDYYRVKKMAHLQIRQFYFYSSSVTSFSFKIEVLNYLQTVLLFFKINS